MKVISIVSQKGGSGKTTLSSLVIKTLSEKGHSVLAIDTDPQAGLSSILLDRGTERKGLYEWLGDDIEIGEAIHSTEGNLFSGRIGVVPSSYKLDKVFLSTSHLAFKPFLKLTGWDFIVIDTPPTVQGITKTAIEISSRVLIPTEISMQALNPTRYTIQTVESQEKKPEVIFSGWKDPQGKGGYQASLSNEFQNSFSKYTVGNIPRNSSTVSFASEWKKASKSVKDGILSSIDAILSRGKFYHVNEGVK